jgi:cytochrome c-type biogenesis protein CcsB
MMLHSSDFFRLAMYAYVVASLLYIIFLVFKKKGVGLGATLVTAAGFLGHTAAILMRWRESYVQLGPGNGYLPMSNMYESMVFFAWSIILIYLFMEWKYKSRAMGVVVAPLAALGIAAVSLSPYFSDEIEPLVPALQSNWMTIHVATCFFGYAAFAISFAVSVIYLLLNTDRPREASWWAARLSLPAVVAAVSLTAASMEAKWVILVAAAMVFMVMLWLGGPRKAQIGGLFPNLKILDDLNYRSIMVGFPMLTLGIITGAAWANYAWGTYWSWDPKETWSLITWFMYAAFLHARFTAGWRGKKAAVLAIIGFGFVIFTYFGVNYLLSGLHSYA